ncbi:MAG: hypothetical protein RMJ16_12400 [Thermoguttaceae bacterium]|nr:hypothetical protein [Thermoguttaceae bacterium]
MVPSPFRMTDLREFRQGNMLLDRRKRQGNDKRKLTQAIVTGISTFLELKEL